MDNLKKISNWLKRKNIHDQAEVSDQLSQLKKKHEELHLSSLIEFEKSVQEYVEIQWEGSEKVKSKLGGRPNLGEGKAWPMCREIPMTFIGQVALSEIPKEVENGFPASGMLYFFLNLDRIENLADDFVGNEMYYFGENVRVLYDRGEEVLAKADEPKGLLQTCMSSKKIELLSSTPSCPFLLRFSQN